MTTKFSVPFLLFLVVFTIILPNHQLVTRVKSSLTLTELEVSGLDVEKTSVLPPENLTTLRLLSAPLTSHKVDLRGPLSPSDKMMNPTLNFLYLAHSPPA